MANSIYKTESGRQAILNAYESLIRRWPVPYETLSLPTCLGNTFAIACGDPASPPLILLHGSSTNAAVWLGDAPVFSQHFRVYALDIPGEPGKSESARPPLAGNAYADWLLDVLSVLHLDRASIMGMSLGGFLSLKFAAAHPDRVEKLVLLCASGIAPQRSSFLWKAIFYMAFGSWGRDQLIRMVNGGAPVPEEVNRYSTVIAENFSPRIEAVPIFADEELRCLTMPVLYYGGAQDALLQSQKSADRLTRLLPHASPHVLPNTGHVLINLTQPILEFLEGD